MVKNAMKALVVLAALLLLDRHAVLAMNNGNILSTIEQRNDIAYQAIVSQADLLTMLYAGPEDNWMVTVIRHPQPGQLPQYHTAFYRKTKDNLFQKWYEYTTVDRFQTAYVTIDRNRLFTVWTTGSAHRLRVFLISDKSIREVLSAGWKRDPEFVHLTKDSELEIIVPGGEIANQEPKFAEIYQWNGSDYILVEKLPWTSRLKNSRKTSKEANAQHP
jgi:hypothetical protein